MKFLSFKATSFCIFFALLVCSLAKAQDDHSAPELVGINIIPASVDVSSEAAQCRIELALKDEQSGVRPYGGNWSYWAIELRSPTWRQERLVFNTQLKLTSGTASNGIWSAEFTMPQYSESGTWKVGVVAIDDAAGNRLFLRPQALEPYSATLSVTSNKTDTTAPKIKSLRFGSVSIGSDGVPQVKVTVRATDDLSGVDMSPDGPTGPSYGMIVELKSPSGTQTASATMYSEWTLVQGTPQNGTWEADVKFPENPEPGTWHLSRLSIKDAVRNMRDYKGDKLLKRQVDLSAPASGN